MRKLLVLLALATGVLATSALPAGAITGDHVEDTEHPFVGVVAFYDESGEYSHRCSGSLLTPTVFLTAGHCTTDFFGSTATARVYFQQDAVADPSNSGFPDDCAPGTLGVTCATSDEIYDYDYATSGSPWRDFPDTRDVGLVILDQPIHLSEYGELAAPGTLDRLATRRGLQETTFTHSGYGATESSPLHRLHLGERLMASSKLTNLKSALTGVYSLQVNFNGKGYGGACYGDSGGPVFYGGYSSNIIVALAGWNNNGNCAGVGYFYRTDRQEVIDWILQTVPQDQVGNIKIVG
jgi:Trypsin